VIVLIVRVHGVRAGELKGHSPVAADLHRPRASAVTLEGMQIQMATILRHSPVPTPMAVGGGKSVKYRNARIV
jgi:hypothetical protein